MALYWVFSIKYHFLRNDVQARYPTDVIRNVVSSAFGKDGKYTHWLKNVTNFNAIPTVPVTATIFRQSWTSSPMVLCICFICHQEY
jgi:hypothetical protein